jgi:cell division protein FtsW
MSARHQPDFTLFLTVLILLSIGVTMVFSSTLWYATLPPFRDTFYFVRKQLIWALIGIVAMVIMMNYDYWRLKKWSKWLLLGGVFLLIAVLIPGVGVSKLGAQRWMDLGPLSFQPSELVKLCLIIFVSHALSRRLKMIQNFWSGVLPFLLLTGLVAGLILLQPDLGTAMTIAGTVFIMLFIAGMKTSQLFMIGTLGLGLVTAAILYKPYRFNRFMAFLHPEKDTTGAGWHILNSLMSLGSGSLFGTGLGQGHSKYLWVPERHTDFIFSIIGEELGFIGATFVIILFIVFIWRGLKTAMDCPDSFGTLLATGIVSGVALQAIINIGVVTSSLPITGITLPFISFGGNSLVITLAGIGILLNVSRYSMHK